MGTPAYMSPEQARGEQLDVRTDLFSLGAVMYEMVTRKLPFQGTTPATMVASLLRDTPEPLLRVNPSLPVELGRIVDKALEKDRDVRYQSAADLRADLKRLRRDTDSGRSLAGATVSAENVGRRRQRWLWIGAVVVGIAMVAAAYKWPWGRQRLGPNLQNLDITKLTDTGDVSNAVISPDGRYVAYMLRGARPSLWVRQVATESAVQVLPPSEGRFMGITFSPDGDYIYFVRERKEDTDWNDLYEVPVLGGSPKLILKNLEGGIAVSLDGKRIAFVRHETGVASTLNIAGVEGGGERVLAEGTGPDYFGMLTRPSWSPDGKLVAATSWWRKDGYTTAVRCYPVHGGKSIILRSRKLIYQVVWLHNEPGLLLAAAPAATKEPRTQIWQQPFPEGEPQRITNDLVGYYDLSLTADDKLLASVQREITAAVFVGPSSDPDQGVPITTAKSDGLTLAWMPNGKLLIQDAKAQFSLAQADGKNRVSFFQDELARGNASVCGSGRFIVFASMRDGSQGAIWRVDADGHDLKRLTEGKGEYGPHCSGFGR
jgi:eukaryotic-like serine/threonine-protein kinase